MSDKNKDVEDTAELRRVIAQLQAQVNALENSIGESDSLADAMSGDIDESYVAYRADEYDNIQEDEETRQRRLEEEARAEAEMDAQIQENEERSQKKKKRKQIIMEEEFGEYDSDVENESLNPEIPEEEIPEKPVKKKTKKRKKNGSDEDVIISMEHVTKSYVKGIPAINDINIKIRRGEFVFIVGESGSGKSTLIRLLLRELKPTSGKIMVNGFQVDRLRHGKIPKLRRSMGVVFQEFRLLKDRSVYENVEFAQRIIQVPARERKKNVPRMLKMVGLASKYKVSPNELSGGERQRVAIARALVNQPPILLADEPTGNLDPRNTVEIMNLLDEINKAGTTVIVVTHNDKIVNDMQKRVITIKNGIIFSDEEKGGYIDED